MKVGKYKMRMYAMWHVPQEIGATLVEGITLRISERCTCRIHNSVDWRNTRGRHNTGDW